MTQQQEPQAVEATRTDKTIVLANGLITLQFDLTTGAFAAKAGQQTFLTQGRLRWPSGEATIVDLSDPIGTGKAVEVAYADGGADRVALYPGVPLVCIQPRLYNGGEAVTVIDTITPATITVDLGRPADKLAVLGCDGLTDATAERASYSFLAAADPATRAGIVAGFLTHNRGSGIVHSSPDGRGIRIEGCSEYGKLRIAPGRTVAGEILAIGYFDDALDGLAAYADTAAAACEVQLPPIPSGYCTWYHARALDAERAAELARFCADHLARFGFEVLQIDDQWQISGRDYTTHNPEGPYPDGMAPTAKTIREAGMTAGLWFIPFGWDHERDIFADHQDWFVHKTDGDVYPVKWAGTCLDMTHPEARRFLRETVSRMTDEWGYKYIKIDGLWSGMAVGIRYPDLAYADDRLGDAVFHDPSKTNVEAYRDGLSLVREAAGNDVFILGCNVAQNMRTLGGSFGRVDGMRVGRDISARWDKVVLCAVAGTWLYFFHGRLWHNDPDCLMLRDPLTLDQARAWGSWIAVSGQMNLVSEWLPDLPAEKLDVVKRSMPNHGLCGRPVDLFDTETPRIWQLSTGQGDARREIVALFNWDEGEARTVAATASSLGLPDGGAWVGFDYWTNAFVGPFTDSVAAEIAPASCRVIALRPALDRPQLVSTSRHICQGVIDVADEAWRPKDNTYAAVSKVVADDPYELRFAAGTGPVPAKAVAAEVSDEDRDADVAIEITDAGPDARVVITSGTSRDVTWRVRFD